MMDTRITDIRKPERYWYEAARLKWDSVAKPLGSFGVLEEFICRIAAVRGSADIRLDKSVVVVMCADNGVVEEGVTQSPQSVTAACALDIAEGRSNINALASQFGAGVLAVDIGMAGKAGSERILERNIMRGTWNIARGPAMDYAAAEAAVSTGMDIVRDLGQGGTDIIFTGEMGIGNTTIASTLASFWLGLPAEEVTGRGAGLSGQGLKRKIDTVKRAIETNRPDRDDPFDVLSKIGGLDVAGLAGVFLGGAYYRIPVVIDGAISAAAAYTAYRIAPGCADYMLAGHKPCETSGLRYLEAMDLRPVIDAGLRLGEGTGGILLLPLLKGALALYRNSHTFDELGIEQYRRQV